MLRPTILFKIFLSDLFLGMNDVNFASYADDNTIYDSAESIDTMILFYDTTRISKKKISEEALVIVD